MTFVAQFCFADSRDLFPALPGDLLLVFIEGKEIRLRHRLPGWSSNIIYAFMWGHGDQRDSAVTFEWVSLGDYPLITSEEMTETSWNIMPCYGAICRTWDYLNDDDGFAYPDVAPHIATTLEAMKIGGMYPSPWVPQDHLGTYLCTLNSVFLEHGPYPFLNVPEPISAEEWRNSSSHLLTIGDMGLMNIFLAADGSVRWAADG